MNGKNILSTVIAASTLFGLTVAPSVAGAQSRADLKHRQEQKNNWRNLGIAGAVLGGYGLLKGDSTLAAIGIGGGLYSASRYEADRKSQGRMEHQRAQYFSRRSFTKNGHHYQRRTIWKNGHKYYGFVRTH